MRDKKKNFENFCCEDISKIENYELAKADNFKGWDCHHRLESEHELFRPTIKQLINNGLYFRRPADELIFMKRLDHMRLHRRIDKELNRGVYSKESKEKLSKSNTGKTHSEETRKKLSSALKGRVPWNKGKKVGSYDEDRKNHISDSMKAYWAAKKENS